MIFEETSVYIYIYIYTDLRQKSNEQRTLYYIRIVVTNNWNDR
jgi:hypothetical protein